VKRSVSFAGVVTKNRSLCQEPATGRAPPLLLQLAVPRPWRGETPHITHHPSCAACPDRAWPRHAWLRAAFAGRRCVLGEPPRRERAAAAGEGREDASGVFSGLHSGKAGAKMPFVSPIRTTTILRHLLDSEIASPTYPTLPTYKHKLRGGDELESNDPPLLSRYSIYVVLPGMLLIFIRNLDLPWLPSLPSWLSWLGWLAGFLFKVWLAYFVIQQARIIFLYIQKARAKRALKQIYKEVVSGHYDGIIRRYFRNR
jgi:hypothetical protein